MSRRAHPPTAALPDLDAGLVRVVAADPPVGALQALVVDHLLDRDGPAWWVDAGGRARTTTLRDLAPSRRLVDRVRVARAFTAHQHAALLATLSDRIRTADPPALVVCPAVDLLARTGDVDAAERDRLLLTGVATLARLARECDCPVVVTRTVEAPEAAAGALDRAADRRLTIESTRFGPRFAGEATGTLAYAPDAGGWRQTTLAYWREVLAARVRRRDDGATTPEVARGTN